MQRVHLSGVSGGAIRAFNGDECDPELNGEVGGYGRYGGMEVACSL